MKFLHAMIRVKDVQKSLAFYQNLLNMTIVKKKRLDDCELIYLEDEEHTAQIELTVNDEIPENGYTVGNAFGHFAFEAENLDETGKKMAEMGYKWEVEPFYMPEVKTRISFLLDPDGNSIELIEARA